jgi:hypothetical protein
LRNIAYQGAALFVNDQPISRATAIGSSYSTPWERITELGNSGVVGFDEDTPSGEVSIDANEFGSIRLLNALASKPSDNQEIIFSRDFDHDSCDIYTRLYDGAVDETNGVLTQLNRNCYLTSATYSFGVDGSFTERYALGCDHKRYFMNGFTVGVMDASQVAVTPAAAGEPGAVTLSVGGQVLSVISIWYDNRKLIKDIDYTMASESSSTLELFAHVNGGQAWLSADNARLKVLYASKDALHNSPLWVSETSGPGSMRRGHIKVLLVTGHTGGFGDTDIEGEAVYNRVHLSQTLSISARIPREEVSELGTFEVLFRRRQAPVEIGVDLDLVLSDLWLLEKVSGKGQDSITMSDLSGKIGLCIELYGDRSMKEDPLKRLVIPRLVATEESANVALTGSATQALSFQANDLKVSSNPGETKEK